MRTAYLKNWTLVAITGQAYWLFGNLYEEVVIAPNWIMNSPLQLKRLHDFFLLTNPTFYFVPLTQLSTLLVWWLTWLNREHTVKKDYQQAAWYALLSAVVNIFIVTTIVIKIFGADFENYGDYLNTLCWRWNVLNIFRMTLVSVTLYYLFNIYRKLDKLSSDRG